jgi:hypothetical protein
MASDEMYAAYYPFRNGAEFLALSDFYVAQGHHDTDCWPHLWSVADEFWEQRKSKDLGGYAAYVKRRATFLKEYIVAMWETSDGSYVVHVEEGEDTDDCSRLAYGFIRMRSEAFSAAYCAQRRPSASTYPVSWKTGEDVLASIKQWAGQTEKTFHDLN